MSTEAGYQAPPGTPGHSLLHMDRDLLSDLHRDFEQRSESTESFVLPIRTGRAWRVPAGHICRLTLVEGAQVGDLNLWNANDPRERFWASRTKQMHAAHISIGDRFWSVLPFLRPMATITGDSMAGYGADEDGGRVHDLLGTRCDPYVRKLLTGADFDYHCHSNLTRAVLPFGLTEFDVHDVLNVFQCTGLNKDDKYYMKTCPGRKGDYFEFFAEIDLLAALSTCPGGDLSINCFEDHNASVKCCRPIGVEVKRVDPQILEKHRWQRPQPANEKYRGCHGLHANAPE